MRSRGVLAAALLAIAACGGGGKPAATAPSEAEVAPARAGGAEAMVPPETMDQVNRALERKRPVVARCLGYAIDNKDLPKGARGKLTLELVIAPSGKAESVKVVRSTLESQALSDCVVRVVEQIQFPELPRPYPTSYTYGFEAM